MKINRALRRTGAILIVGILMAVLVAYVERSTFSTFHRNLPFITLGDESRNNVMHAAIQLNNAMHGDNTVNVDKHVFGAIQSTAATLQKAYDGGELDGKIYVRPSEENTRVLLREAALETEQLAQLAKSRWDLKGRAPVVDSTGTVISNPLADADKQFNAGLDHTLVALSKITEHFTARADADTSTLQFFSWISITLVAVAFVLICFWLYRIFRKNEKQVTQSETKLTEEVQRVDMLTHFVESVSSGNYNIDLQEKTTGDDGLTNTLVTMRDKLRENAENDRRRNWSTTGLAKIGEILRDTSGTSVDLYDKIIQFVVKYTRSNQGGLFILNDDTENDPYMELVSAYAFERKKFIQKRIDIGVGLVGQCFLEGERIYLLEVPDEYVTITSGLGGSVPRALLIVPMKVNEKTHGVIELATFSKFEEFEIELVEKLAESIASTISSVKITESTKSLLERTQQQAEEMRAQEEEMRQNMEELEATQEEMRRKEKHIQKMLDDEKERNAFTVSSRKKLATLTKNQDVQAGNWQKTTEVVTASIAQQLGTSRCSIWTYDREGRKLVCEKLFLSGRNVYESGKEFHERDYPAFFRTIQKEEDIIAANAHTHADLRELSDGYLAPLNIESVLDVPFFNEGKIIGIISCEHQHEQKTWTDEHIEFLKSCADLLTVAYKSMSMNTIVEKLHTSQDTLQVIIDNIPRAIFWKDSDLRIQGCNKIFSDVAGLASPRDIVGKSDYDMPWKSQADLYRADDLSVMKEGKPRLNLEEVNIDSDGNESWVLTSKVPIRDEHDKVIAVLGMFEDITDRKRREADIAKKLEELDHLKKMLEERKG